MGKESSHESIKGQRMATIQSLKKMGGGAVVGLRALGQAKMTNHLGSLSFHPSI
jgi:hypothetical protein